MKPQPPTPPKPVQRNNKIKIILIKFMFDLIGSLIGLTGFILLWIYYDYKLALFVFLMLLGNNLEQKNKNK